MIQETIWRCYKGNGYIYPRGGAILYNNVLKTAIFSIFSKAKWRHHVAKIENRGMSRTAHIPQLQFKPLTIFIPSPNNSGALQQ